jgi:ATP-dependent DNA ligase
MSAFRFIPPCSPIRAAAVPAGDGWAHEVKFDGYRVQAHKVGSRVVIFSRNGHDFTERLPARAASQVGGSGGRSRRQRCEDFRIVRSDYDIQNP